MGQVGKKLPISLRNDSEEPWSHCPRLVDSVHERMILKRPVDNG